MIFGPKQRDWSIKINKMEKTLAISSALASAAVNTVVVEEFRDEFEGNAKMEEFIAVMKSGDWIRRRSSLSHFPSHQVWIMNLT